MEENSLTESILRTAGLLLILTVVIVLGWNEPLKYRFMSREEIYALENPQREKPNSGSWMWNKGEGTLDRGAYNRSGSSSRSSSYPPILWNK